MLCGRLLLCDYRRFEPSVGDPLGRREWGVEGVRYFGAGEQNIHESDRISYGPQRLKNSTCVLFLAVESRDMLSRYSLREKQSSRGREHLVESAQ